jgi:hypothetical protein
MQSEFEDSGERSRAMKEELIEQELGNVKTNE